MTSCTVEGSAHWPSLLIFRATCDWAVVQQFICVQYPYTIQISMSMNRAWIFFYSISYSKEPNYGGTGAWKTWGSLLVTFGSIMPDPSWTTSKLHQSYDLVAPYEPRSCSTVLASWPLMSHSHGLICPSAQEHAKSYFLNSGSFSTADGMALFQNPRDLHGNFPFEAYYKLHITSLPITDTPIPVM